MAPVLYNQLTVLSITFLIALILFHLLLVWPKNIRKKAWKYVDYVCITVTFLTVVSLSGDLRRKNAMLDLQISHGRVQAMHDIFTNLYITNPPSYICRTFIRSEFSPDNLVEIQAEYDKFCAWFEKIGPIFSKSTKERFKIIELKQLNPPATNISSLIDILKEVDKQLSFYNQEVKDYNRLAMLTKETSSEIIFHKLWPFLFVVTLALSMAKVTGELLLEE